MRRDQKRDELEGKRDEKDEEDEMDEMRKRERKKKKESETFPGARRELIGTFGTRVLRIGQEVL